MNHINNIEIQNFKSIKHCIIDGCKRINVFVGAPNVGKSNILEGLGLFAVNGTGESKYYLRMQGAPTVFFDADISKIPQIIIDKKYRVKINISGQMLTVESQFENDGKSFFYNDDGLIHLDGKNKVDVFSSFTISSKEISSYNRSGKSESSTLPEFKRYIFDKDINLKKTVDGYQKELNSPIGDNIFQIIYTNPILKKEIDSYFSQYEMELLFESNDQIYKIIKKTKIGIFAIPYEMVADTLRRAIFFVTAIRTNKNSVLLFEEPEAQMYPPYISKLTGEIIADENNNQFFIATHSPYVINDLLEDARDDLSIYLIDYKDGETKVQRMDEQEMNDAYQFGSDFFMNIPNFIRE